MSDCLDSVYATFVDTLVSIVPALLEIEQQWSIRSWKVLIFPWLLRDRVGERFVKFRGPLYKNQIR